MLAMSTLWTVLLYREVWKLDNMILEAEESSRIAHETVLKVHFIRRRKEMNIGFVAWSCFVLSLATSHLGTVGPLSGRQLNATIYERGSKSFKPERVLRETINSTNQIKDLRFSTKRIPKYKSPRLHQPRHASNYAQSVPGPPPPPLPI